MKLLLYSNMADVMIIILPGIGGVIIDWSWCGVGLVGGGGGGGARARVCHVTSNMVSVSHHMMS